MRSFALLAFALSTTSVFAQQTFFGGSVSYTLPNTVGACGRVCNGTITCKSTTGPNKSCTGADGGVHIDVFFSKYNASAPAALNPICGQFFNAIGPISTTSGKVCTFFGTSASTSSKDLQLSDPTNVRPGQTGTWLLFNN